MIAPPHPPPPQPTVVCSIRNSNENKRELCWWWWWWQQRRWCCWYSNLLDLSIRNLQQNSAELCQKQLAPSFGFGMIIFFMNGEHNDRVIMFPTTRTFVLSNWDRTKKICSHMPNITSNSFNYLRTKVRSLPCLVNKSVAYLIFVISFTQAKFSENKIYTEKHVNYKNGSRAK